MVTIYWLFNSSRRRGWDRVKGVDGGNYQFLPAASITLLRGHKNLVQHPCNNISIFIVFNDMCKAKFVILCTFYDLIIIYDIGVKQ